jgi:hypothetical protein
VFALWDGEIKTDGIIAQADANGVFRVKKGDVLLVLENEQLNEEIAKADAEIEKLQEQMAAIDRTLPNVEIKGDIRQAHDLKIQKIGLESELQIAEGRKTMLETRKKEKLSVVAPADGIIPDFKRMEILRGRPVKQGDHLFDVMNENGPWHMELLVEEKRMGHINKARVDMLESSSTDQLKGQFTVVSLPQSKFDCQLTAIASRSTLDQELGTAYELIAVGEEGVELPTQQIGSEVTARFECGKVTLAFYCFGDVVEFLQRNMWWF